MRIRVKGRILNIEHVWFEDFVSSESNSDITIYHSSNTNCEKAGSIFYSLTTELLMKDDMLMKQFSSTRRNEINRAIRENCRTEVFDSNSLKEHDDILSIFASMYHQLYMEKGMPGHNIHMSEVKSYISANAFVLTAAYIDDSPVVFHSYIVGEGRARLLHSCSNLRSATKEMRNMIGRANSLLHRDDLIYMKNREVYVFDWGGVSSLDEPNGIDLYKMSFGGAPTQYYVIRNRNTLKAKLIHLALQIKDRIKK